MSIINDIPEISYISDTSMPIDSCPIIGSSENHIFKPARYIIVHGEINKAQIDRSIEKYNDKNNAFGHEYMILLGSKMIRESYDIKGIQNVFIVGRPDNISTLIQIRGRAVRKGSHLDLPPENRHVSLKIFTTCMPNKNELSYEEQKYKEKIESFQVIQNIEKVLHENAIDVYNNYDTIKTDSDDPLAPLPFDLKVTNKKFKLDELNLSTFNIYHNEKEVNAIKVIIKKLFIELSSVWEHNELFQAIKKLKMFDTEINTELFSEDNYLIALNNLVYNDNIINKNGSQKDMYSIIDNIYDSTEKIITLPNGIDNVICAVNDNKQYYILFPINELNKPNIDIDRPYRLAKKEPIITINMNAFIQNKKIDFDYDDKKKIFYNKYLSIEIENMENIVCEYGSNFHIKFLEECIEYVFNVWTNPKKNKHEMHDFYFKMLYYYDLLSLVIWAHTVKPKFFNLYSKYCIPVKSKDIKIKTLEKYEKRRAGEKIEALDADDNDELSTSGVINLLKTNMLKSSNVWIPQEFRIEYEKTIEESLKLYTDKKKTKVVKIKANLLPVGHFIDKFPKLYIPDSEVFQEEPTYVKLDQDYIENDFIIGYDERSATGVHIRFKLRAPKQSIKKYKDARLIEKGVVCKSKSKDNLYEIMDKLEINYPPKLNVEEICSLIRTKLIRLELKERIKKSKLKYFYFHYEQQ